MTDVGLRISPPSLACYGVAQGSQRMGEGQFFEVSIHNITDDNELRWCYKQFLPIAVAHSNRAEVIFKRVRLQPAPLAAYTSTSPLLYFVSSDNGQQSGLGDDDDQDLPPYLPSVDEQHKGEHTAENDTHLADVRFSVEHSPSDGTTCHIHYSVSTPHSPLHSCSDAFDKFARNLLAYVASWKWSLWHRRRVDRVCLYVPEDEVSHRLALKCMGVAGSPTLQQVVYTFTPDMIYALPTDCQM
ncbi:hypothetical protein RI367_002492 [Sorochytrium milnesiophthora]